MLDHDWSQDLEEKSHVQMRRPRSDLSNTTSPAGDSLLCRRRVCVRRRSNPPPAGVHLPQRAPPRLLRHGQQRRVERRPQPGGGIPARNRPEAGVADDAAAAGGPAGRDVGEAGARGGAAVQPRVQEAERPQAGGQAVAVQQLDDARKGRARGAGAADGLGRARHEDEEVGRLGRHVGVRAAGLVEVGRGGGVRGVGRQPALDGGGLACSGPLRVVPPTVVTQGHEAGKEVVKVVVEPDWHVVPTPESPEATSTDTPRAPSCANRLHTWFA
ncbi:unnamed protein product [Diplocarpon coronariae]